MMMKWGLIPFFTTFLADFKGFSTINARAVNSQTPSA
jgi:hypothetical protein